MAAAANPAALGGRYPVKLGVSNKSKTLNPPAANMIGIIIRKEKRAAEDRSRWRVMPPVMVPPERGVPGNNEIACATPIHSASFQVSVSRVRFFLPLLSAIKSSPADPNRNRAVACTEWKAAST